MEEFKQNLDDLWPEVLQSVSYIEKEAGFADCQTLSSCHSEAMEKHSSHVRGIYQPNRRPWGVCVSHMYRDMMPKRRCAVRSGPLLASHNLDLEARYWLCILTGCLEVRADHSVPDDPHRLASLLEPPDSPKKRVEENCTSLDKIFSAMNARSMSSS